MSHVDALYWCSLLSIDGMALCYPLGIQYDEHRYHRGSSICGTPK